MKGIVSEVIMWTVVGALLVLVIKNAGNFAVAVTSVGNVSNTTLGLLSGSNYQGGQSVAPSGVQVLRAA